MNERTFFIAPFFFSVKDNSLFNKTQNENIMPVILSKAKDLAHLPIYVYDLPSCLVLKNPSFRSSCRGCPLRHHPSLADPFAIKKYIH